MFNKVYLHSSLCCVDVIDFLQNIGSYIAVTIKYKHLMHIKIITTLTPDSKRRVLSVLNYKQLMRLKCIHLNNYLNKEVEAALIINPLDRNTAAQTPNVPVIGVNDCTMFLSCLFIITGEFIGTVRPLLAYCQSGYKVHK